VPATANINEKTLVNRLIYESLNFLFLTCAQNLKTLRIFKKISINSVMKNIIIKSSILSASSIPYLHIIELKK